MEKTVKNALVKFSKALEAAKNSTDHPGTIERLDNEIQLYDHWAMSDDNVAIVVSNWNNVKDRVSAPEYWRGANNIMRRLEAYAEKMARMGWPIEIAWSDMVTDCDDCGGLLDTESAHMWWKPQYTFDEKVGEVICHKCMPPNKGEDES